MPLVRVSMSMSLDGYVAGPRQSADDPLGVGGMAIHEWAFATRTFHAMTGREGGEAGPDDDRMAASRAGIGAVVMGRNMFGPVRGPWGDEDWRGWWGEEPPYHAPVFVLTHHARDPVPMRGGTTFHFVTGGVQEAHARAVDAAGDRDVEVGGGADTVRQFLRAGLIDVIDLQVAPVVLGEGERLLDGAADAFRALRCTEVAASPRVAHFRWERAPER